MASTAAKTEASDTVLERAQQPSSSPEAETAESERVDQSEIKTLSESDTATKPAVENGEVTKEKNPTLNVLRQKLISAKRVFSDRLMKSFHGDRGDDRATRLYHVWPGNNVFFFGGRVVCGPDPRGMVLTTMAILLSSWSFAAYVADDIPYNFGPKIICLLIFTFIVLVNLAMVSMIDPGILPRGHQSLIDRVAGEGIEVRMKYCRICNIYSPPRSHHCNVCDNCVDKFDHHCPWIGQCIGLRNYKLYIILLFMALVFFAYIFAFSFRKIQRRMFRNDDGLIGMLRNCPETLALASFTFVAAWILGGLTSYNLYLVALNQTSYENFHQHYASSSNPYDRGLFSNFMEVLCQSRPLPKVDFRAEVIGRENSSPPCIIYDQV
ncbi:hypothetical protein C2S51_038102 [Perilla frutescens var. frutescens]|nr:hypothetical protein C2S51_038102 [Perilla frutescens var. frutescens]